VTPHDKTKPPKPVPKPEPQLPRKQRRKKEAGERKGRALVQQAVNAAPGVFPLSRGIIEGAARLKQRGVFSQPEYDYVVKYAKGLRDAATGTP
jgi:hypothetical protein